VAAQLFYMMATMLIAVPTGVKVFNWTATMWRGSLSFEPPMLFAIAFLFVLVMLVQFSMTISRLSDQNTALAQRLALLQQRQEAEHSGANGHGAAEEPAGAAGALSGPTDPA